MWLSINQIDYIYNANYFTRQTGPKIVIKAICLLKNENQSTKIRQEIHLPFRSCTHAMNITRLKQRRSNRNIQRIIISLSHAQLSAIWGEITSQA